MGPKEEIFETVQRETQWLPLIAYKPLIVHFDLLMSVKALHDAFLSIAGLNESSRKNTQRSSCLLHLRIRK